LKSIARAAASVAVVLAVALCQGPATGKESARSDAPALLRNEDVVRMLVAGRPATEVIAAILSADTAFDLADEMAQELRLAGVPADVLSAMAARQAELDRARAAAAPPPAAVPEPPAEGTALLVVTLRPGATRGASKDLLFPAKLDDDTARALQAGDSDAERAVTDLAVFLACRTPDHVPDAWRSRTPLGGDFVSVARHRMLAFHAGATRLPAAKAPPGERGKAAPDLLALALPVELRADVEPGIVHDLVVGVAIRAGDRYLEIAEARKDGVIVGLAGLSLGADLAARGEEGPSRIHVRFEGDAPAGAPRP
jgi:hypothetical protein